VTWPFLVDLWDEKFEGLLNFVDEDAGARCLISTRVRILLAEQDSLQVQLPSASEARLDEGILSLSLTIFCCIWNPYRYDKFQRRITVRPRISTQAAHIVMAAAGASADSSSAIPAEVFEVVKLCGRLPLALEMAGRLIHGFGLHTGRSWKGIPEVIGEHLKSDGGVDGTGVEDRLITASLASMSCPPVRSIWTRRRP
jgi:hypothetical protein